MRDFLGNPMFSVRPDFDPGILILDDLETQFLWTESGTGGDDVHARVVMAGCFGGYGMELRTRATGATAGDNLKVTRKVWQAASGLLVMRCRMRVKVRANCSSAFIEIRERNGYYEGLARLSWVANAYGMEYLNSAGSMGAVGGFQLPYDEDVWINLGMVLDVRTKEYIELEINGRTIDMSGYAYQTIGVSSRGQVDVAIGIVTPTTTQAYVQVDNVYVGTHRDV